MLKRKDGRWQDQVKLPGMKNPKYFYGKTQKEVKRKIAVWTQEQVAGKPFELAADAWDVWHADHVTYNAGEAYRAALSRTKEHFQGRDVGEIKADEIDAYIQYLAGRGYSRRTVQLHRDMLNMIFNYAIIQRWAESNPCAPVKIPAGLPKGKRDIPLEEQLERVKMGLSLEFGLFPFMLLYTGMRRGELLALRWEDIDRKAKTIRVEKSVYFVGNEPHIKIPKTDAGRREVVLLHALEEVLPRTGKGYIFGGDRPLTKSSLRKRWLMWARQAGLARRIEQEKEGKDGQKHTSVQWKADITPHQLRHAFATILFDAGVDVKDAQEILGHASIQVTRDIYTHIRKKRKESTAAMINRYLEQNGEDCQNNVIRIGT